MLLLLLPRKQNLHNIQNFSFCKLTLCGNVSHFCDIACACSSLLRVIFFQNSYYLPQVTILMLVHLKSLTYRRYVSAPKLICGHQSYSAGWFKSLLCDDGEDLCFQRHIFCFYLSVSERIFRQIYFLSSPPLLFFWGGGGANVDWRIVRGYVHL